MKNLIKLLIVLAVLHALFRGSQAAWSYYQLKDAALQAIIFGAGASTGELHDQVLTKAMELGLPLQPENLMLQRDGDRTFAQASYTQPIEFLPGFRRPVTLSFAVDAVAAKPAKPDDL
jgi:hypothetical protein